MRRPSSPPKPPRGVEPGRRPRPAGRGAPPREADTSQDRDLIAICGLAAVQAVFARDARRVERLFFEPAFAPPLVEARRAMAAARRPYREVQSDELARIAGTVRHGGVVAIARPRPLPPFDPVLVPQWAKGGSTVLVLDGIGNPHNLGAIIRSAAFFGVERVLLADRPEQALPSAAAYRIAEGGFEAVSLYRADLAVALPALKPAYRVIGTALGTAAPVADLRRGRPVALVLGNEENGIDPATLALCDAVVRIPGQRARVQSLNVAAAAAVLLYALAPP